MTDTQYVALPPLTGGTRMCLYVVLLVISHIANILIPQLWVQYHMNPWELD